MKLAGATVLLLVAAEGLPILELQGFKAESSGLFKVEVRESEDLGLWVLMDRDGKTHFMLVRWDYILSIDMPGDFENPLIGLKGIR